MRSIRHLALVGSASMVFACVSLPDAGGSGDTADGGAVDPRPPGRGGPPEATHDAGVPTQSQEAGPSFEAGPGSSSDARTGHDAATVPQEYTLTITSPQQDAAVSGAIQVTGTGPGFLNVEVHAPGGSLLARVTPDASGGFSASVDTTALQDGAVTLTLSAWDAPAGAEYTHTATASLALDISNGVGSTGPDAGQSCVDANGNGIRYFGAYTKNTQTNYDFDSWSGFHQDFLTSFINCDTWANMAASDWGFQIMQQQPPGENIQEIVCLSTTEDPSLEHVGAGMYDSYIQQAGNLFLEYNYPNAVIRLGHEFEGNWYPWGMDGGPNNMDYAGFISAFRHVSGILKSISPTFTIVWNPGCGYYAEAMDDEKAYPGDDVVDVIGVDCYDDGSGMDHIFNGAYGMNQWAAFAHQHGKPIALPEWGLMAGGDDPAYIQAMFNFMVGTNTFLEAFWDSDDGSTQSQITTGEAPLSGAMFLQTFGQYAKGCHP